MIDMNEKTDENGKRYKKKERKKERKKENEFDHNRIRNLIEE